MDSQREDQRFGAKSPVVVLALWWLKCEGLLETEALIGIHARV